MAACAGRSRCEAAEGRAMERVQIELQMVHADDGLEGVLTMLSRTPHTAQRVSCGAVGRS